MKMSRLRGAQQRSAGHDFSGEHSQDQSSLGPTYMSTGSGAVCPTSRSAAACCGTHLTPDTTA